MRRRMTANSKASLETATATGNSLAVAGSVNRPLGSLLFLFSFFLLLLILSTEFYFSLLSSIKAPASLQRALSCQWADVGDGGSVLWKRRQNSETKFCWRRIGIFSQCVLLCVLVFAIFCFPHLCFCFHLSFHLCVCGERGLWSVILYRFLFIYLWPGDKIPTHTHSAVIWVSVCVSLSLPVCFFVSAPGFVCLCVFLFCSLFVIPWSLITFTFTTITTFLLFFIPSLWLGKSPLLFELLLKLINSNRTHHFRNDGSPFSIQSLSLSLSLVLYKAGRHLPLQCRFNSDAELYCCCLSRTNCFLRIVFCFALLSFPFLWSFPSLQLWG